MSLDVSSREFGRLPDGMVAELFSIRNNRRTEVNLTNWGGIITSVRTVDRDGTLGEITLARDTLREYLEGHPYYGALVGRVANRISRGGFTLDGTRYPLPSNLGDLHLHGGVRGFDKQIYHAEVIREDRRAGVTLSRTSPAGEEGYPGELLARCTVTLSDDDVLRFTFDAETDHATVVNLTNHCYWNLSGEATILDHELYLAADGVAETDRQAVPTGRLLPVAEGPFDFSAWKPIRPGFEELQRVGVNGFDHSLAIAGWSENAAAELRETAAVRSVRSGRMMTVSTTYPAVHFYSGNNLAGETGRHSGKLRGQEALCLECQYFPDAPNRPEFPSIVLRPGERYHHVTEHRFTTFSLPR